MSFSVTLSIKSLGWLLNVRYCIKYQRTKPSQLFVTDVQTVNVYIQLLSCAQLFVDPWNITQQTPLSMEFFQARILGPVAISYSRGIFLTQGSNSHLLHLLHWKVDSLNTNTT